MNQDFESELCIDGSTTDLPRIIDFVESTCEKAGIDVAARFDLKLAVEEACANVIEHAYGGEGGRLTVCFAVCGPDVRVTVTDQGQPFDPGQVAMPDLSRPLEERPVGGLGLFLMQRLMDDVRFSFTDEGNEVSMMKYGVRSLAVP